MNITEEQLEKLKNLNDSRVNEILNMTPELNKWYKATDNKFMIYLTKYKDNNICEGFYFSGLNGKYMGFCDNLGFRRCILATKQEIEQALTNEAKRRGFKEGVKFKCLISAKVGILTEDYFIYNSSFGGSNSLESAFKNDNINSVLFKDGVWAGNINKKAELKQEIKELEVKLQELREKL